MIRDAVLRKIIRPNFFFASARADLAAALRAVFGCFLLLLPLEEAGPQDRQRFFLILELAATVLATNDRARGNVQYLHG